METTDYNPVSIENLKKDLALKKYELEIAKFRVSNAKMALEMAIQNNTIIKTEKKAEVKAVQAKKSDFELLEIISENYRVPSENEDYIFKTSSDILNELVKMGKIKKNDKNVSAVKLGVCMNKLDFPKTAARVGNNSRHGYAVVKKGAQS